MKKILLIIGLCIILLSSICFAVKPTVETPSNDIGLQIIYPEFSIYKIGINPITFNFHIYNSTNFLMTNTTVNCSIHIYNFSGNHKIVANLTYDSSDKDFKYILNTSYITTPQPVTYLVDCNSPSEYGFLANGVLFNRLGQDNSVNTSGYIALILMIFGVIFVLFFIAERIEFGYFIDSKGQPIQFFKYLVWIISGWILLIPIQTAIKLIEVYNYFDTSLYEVIYTSVIYIMLFLTTIWLVGFLYKILESMDMFNMKE